MNWKIKAGIQMATSYVPFGSRLNYAGQRLLMRRFSSLDRSVADRLAKARWLLGAYTRHAAVAPERAHFFELGTGWHLGLPLALWCLGVERQVTVDVRRLARLELINKALAVLQNLPEDLPRRPGGPIRRFEELADRYGIAYRAPCDARCTGLAADSIDCAHSTFTLQHIPVPILMSILAESRRILKPEGVLLSIIDYGDNYAYTDRSISVYNFLRYSGSRWRWLNPPLHYQNRLRHVEYRALFDACGLRVVEQELKCGSERDLAAIRAMRLAPEFSRYAPEELAIRTSRLAAVKGPAE